MKEYVVHYKDKDGQELSIVVKAQDETVALRQFKKLDESRGTSVVLVNEILFG